MANKCEIPPGILYWGVDLIATAWGKDPENERIRIVYFFSKSELIITKNKKLHRRFANLRAATA